MSEKLKMNAEGKTESIDKLEEERTSKAEMEKIWDDIIVDAVTSIPWETADKVAMRAEREITEKIGEILRRTVKRNVANAIGDALTEVKEHFMEITESTNPEE